MPVDIGDQLGNYRLVKLIGKGGFADVYLGEHVYLNTNAAIKVLQIRLADVTLDKFLAEARTIARLTHPNIIPVLEFGIEAQVPFLVMVYAPYGSLRQRHPMNTRVPLPLLLPYVRQVAEALQYAHTNNIIHRDVKPENMLLGQQQNVLLSDFGIATSVVTEQGEEHITTGAVGTAVYMAPEQIDGQPTFASDQYALAVAVYEWLCGQPPFNGTPVSIAMQHLQSPPPPLRERVPTLSPALEQVILRALAKEPQQRFATIREFARALEEVATRPTNRLTLSAKLPSAPGGLRLASQPLFLPNTQTANYTATPDNLTIPATEFARPDRTPITIHPEQQRSTQPEITLNRRQITYGLFGVATLGAGIYAATNLLPTLFHTSTTKPRVQQRPKPTATPNLNATMQANITQATINATTTRPALCAGANNTLHLFVRGSDNALWHRPYDGTQWLNWESLGGPLSYDPVVTSWGPDRFDLFVRGADNSLQYRWYDGTWHDWSSLSGVITADPCVTSWGPGRLDVFVRGLDSALWHRAYDGTWHDWESLGGLFLSSPTVAAWSPGRLDVFVRGIIGTLAHKWYDGTWHDWEDLGGTFVSDPAATTTGAGQLDIFVRGTEDVLKRRNFNGTAWQEWELLGGALTTAPTATLWNQRLEVGARTTNNLLQHRWYDGSWHDWTALF